MYRISYRFLVPGWSAKPLVSAHDRIMGTHRIGATNLGNWVRQARVDRGERDGVTTSERAELAELRRENFRLRQERELLKRATAFWVRELGQ